jgi:hypothetical protein
MNTDCSLVEVLCSLNIFIYLLWVLAVRTQSMGRVFVPIKNGAWGLVITTTLFVVAVHAPAGALPLVTLFATVFRQVTSVSSGLC